MSINSDEKTLYRPVAAIAVVRNPIKSQEFEQSDFHSISRQPDQTLYLFVKKPRTDHAWQFPQGGIKFKKRKETLKEAALRELSEECGSDLQVNVLEQEPFHVYQYDFPSDFVQKKKRNYKGAQVQFIKAEWISGQCQPDGKEIVDFAWLTRDEILQFVSTEYGNGIMPLFKST
ncbi:hypothetical protein G6F37_008929 [Rhizopus arrhizus]|nr:hypothetical protein G6F38_002699 [Rhizopus arrhizus]KAG1155011.1 hypothetical protein G6F37_008929 [Rhizopus arrhizus]